MAYDRLHEQSLNIKRINSGIMVLKRLKKYIAFFRNWLIKFSRTIKLINFHAT